MSYVVKDDVGDYLSDVGLNEFGLDAVFSDELKKAQRFGVSSFASTTVEALRVSGVLGLRVVRVVPKSSRK